ncbi:MAG: hypothetical protein PHS53_00765 [Candidatus Pacebacteria bacterium]|nr:hypothetical protein [Candidatus Paceibacterota bacterium]MDD5356669.1 hypothetical protein [Candidatus Paceibacterota bacterium]
MLIPQTMLQIVQSGANLTIDLNKQIVIPQVMVQLAAAAAISGSMVTFKNCDGKIIPPTFISVAQAGRGHVSFEQ